MIQPILFEHFQPGAVIGETTEVFSPQLADRWHQIFGNAQQTRAQGASLAVVMMMRAYLAVVSPRPPGNVHARQRFTLQRLPEQGESVTTRITCLSKELRRERRYVELEAHGRNASGAPMYRASMTLIWAA